MAVEHRVEYLVIQIELGISTLNLQNTYDIIKDCDLKLLLD